MSELRHLSMQLLVNSGCEKSSISCMASRHGKRLFKNLNRLEVVLAATYSVGNPQDASSSSAYIFVQVLSTNAGPANLLPPLMGLGDDAIIFAGVPGLTYTLQRAPAVTGPWRTIATVTVGSAGIGTYLDPDKPAGSAFYRITYP